MKKIMCLIHKIDLELATTEEEFLSGKLHDETIRIQEHIEDFPQCKMRLKK